MTTHPLFNLLVQLEEAGIHFTLARNRPDSVRVTMHVVGERTEIDVLADGGMEVSRFLGDESVVCDAALVANLITQNRT